MNPTKEVKMEAIIKDILDGRFFPINLYVNYIRCNCEPTPVWGSTKEELSKTKITCEKCKGPITISDPEPAPCATLIRLQKPDESNRGIILNELKPEDIYRLHKASIQLLKSQPRMRWVVDARIRKLNKDMQIERRSL